MLTALAKVPKSVDGSSTVEPTSLPAPAGIMTVDTGEQFGTLP